MQDNVLEIIKRRLENEEEMSFANFEEYAELYGYNETEDYFSFGLKRAIEIISVYIKLEKDEKNEEKELLQKIQAIVSDCLSPCSLMPIEGIIAIKKLLKEENNENLKKKENEKSQE